MRRLVVTRGPQGAGKSTALAQAGLADYTLSADAIRLILGGPVMSPLGALEVDQSQNGRAWRVLHRTLEERMARGELVCVDATHPSASAFRPYVALIERFGYEAMCLDFSGMDEAEVLARNRRRPPHHVVPEAVVRRTITECALSPGPPTPFERLGWDASGSHVDALRAWVNGAPIEVDEPIWLGHGDPPPGRTPWFAVILGTEPAPSGATAVVAPHFCGLAGARDALWLRSGALEVLVTPGPLPAWPDALALIPSAQLASGVGVDPAALFDASAPAGRWNVHLGPTSVGRSVSLLTADVLVEPGGRLTVVGREGINAAW